MSFNRRHFLHGSAGALGAIGLSQLGLTHSATRYGKVLAAATPRKVALLVGINDYRSNRLEGPINDVELQRQLLIHRFGFKDSDIHILCNEQASRRNVWETFNEYLYEPARPGDVVIFHFSGHGEKIRERDRMEQLLTQIQRTCIDIDDLGECNSLYNTAIATFPDDTPEQDIMGHTLLLMRAALAQKTDNVTFLLDCCYAGGGKRGNAVMRSLNASLDATEDISNLRQIPESEWTYQRQLLDTLDWNAQQFADAITAPKGQGFFVGAVRRNQLAADYSFDGFTAGAFTYLLTQHLWQNTDSLAETIPMVGNSANRLAEHSQVPVYDPARENDPVVNQKPIYHIEPISQPAEALILDAVREKANNDEVTLWLGGLDPWSLESFDQGAIFSVIDKTTGKELAEVQQIDGTRQGLVTQGRLVSTTRGANVSSQLLQEKVRGISSQVTLKIGLDDTLTPTEQQIVLDNLGALSDFDVFVAEPGKMAHVLLGRYTAEIDQRVSLIETNPRLRQTVGSIGIFSPAQVPLLVGSFGDSGETMENALGRLKARVVSLYLGRMLALMVNQQTSHLDVSVEVEHLGSRSGTTTRRGDPEAIFIPQQFERGIEQIAIGNEIEVTVHNNETQDLHFGIVVIDAAGEVNVLFPLTTDNEDADVISRRGSWSTKLRGAEPLGITELLVLVSPQSLVSPLKTLRLKAPRVNSSLSRGAISTNVDAMNDIFGAMDTRRGSVNTAKGTRLLDVDQVAVLSLFVDIVPGDAS